MSTTIRLTPDLHRRMHDWCEQTGVPLNWLVNRLCEEGMGVIIPAEEFRLTSRPDDEHQRRENTKPLAAARLFCDPNVWDEYFTELDSWVEAYARTCSAGTQRLTVIEYDCHPPGDTGNERVPRGIDIAEKVAEDFGDVCEWFDVAEQYAAAAKHPEVVAAFEAARDALVSRQTFLCARDMVAEHPIWLTVSDDLSFEWGELADE